ncbi:MAG TPA: sugar ABC transporter permease [Tepidisphaeraceae bacterium]|jgi:ABC-type sugar transport system permease subunit
MNHDRSWRWQRKSAPYLFLSPFALLFLVFMAYPLGRSLVLSFFKTAGPRDMRYIGLGNYRFLLGDRVFWGAVLNTAVFTAAFITVQVPASLGLAMLLNSPRLRGRSFFRFAFFSSYLVGPVFVAILFGMLLDERHGMVNLLLRRIGLISEPVGFLTNPELAMLSTLMAALWLSVGFGMIYFLAALQGVDRQLYEAAEVDGAGRWSRFRHVTLPGIRPVLVFMVLVGTIAGFQLFELPYVLFQGAGPGARGLTIVMYLFIWGFGAGDLGYAAAIGWMLVAIILVVALAQVKGMRIAKEGSARG